jgi:hypothetical protein
MTQLQLNLSESRRRKERGMSLAASRNSEWIALALEDLRVFAAERGEFCIEHFRAQRRILHKPEPTSSAVWGAFCHAAVRAGIIRWTGRYTQASSVKTHSHSVKVWAKA